MVSDSSAHVLVQAFVAISVDLMRSSFVGATRLNEVNSAFRKLTLVLLLAAAGTDNAVSSSQSLIKSSWGRIRAL